MREVKKEVYGSRKSVLAGLFLDNGIQYIHNIWFLTCRAEINQNIKTRYLVLVENDDTINTGIFKPYVPIFRFVKSNKKALITDLRNGDQIVCNSKREIRQWIIEKTDCELVESTALGSKESTWLSAFFREHLGSGFSITDVDFFVTKHSVFIEEKGFIINGCGLLGDGQFRSFAEIKNDICMNIELKIVVIQDDDFYVVDFNSIDPNRKNAKTKWGEMIEFDLGPKYSREEIVRMYK